METSKILITGGHPTPALALIDYLQVHKPHTTIIFIGRRYVNSHEHDDSFEYKEVTDRHIPFIHLSAERKLRGLIGLPYQLIRSLKILMKEKPGRVISFGGYLGVPVCIAAYVLRVPVFLHEQTLRPGMANEWIGKIARKVMITFPQTASYFDSKKIVVTGNPVRDAIVHVRVENSFDRLSKPILFVNGGNLGSHVINTHIFTIISRLLTKFSVIHQIGNVREFNDWRKGNELKNSLPYELRDQYVIMQHLPTGMMGEALRHASLVVSRSGANTIMELIALHKPAVLIPLPWSARGEQQAQALLLEEAGAALLFNQNETSQSLLNCIQTVFDHVQSYSTNYDSLNKLYKSKASEHIAETILAEPLHT